MTIQTARWIHGNTFNVEYPDRLVGQEYKGWGAVFLMKPGTSNWFHISIPTPVIIDGLRPLLSKIFILHSTAPELGAYITDIHIYDGYHKVKEFEGNYSGNHLKSLDAMNTWKLDSPLQIQSGLGVSVRVECPKIFNESSHAVNFASAGADFIKA